MESSDGFSNVTIVATVYRVKGGIGQKLATAAASARHDWSEPSSSHTYEHNSASPNSFEGKCFVFSISSTCIRSIKVASLTSEDEQSWGGKT